MRMATVLMASLFLLASCATMESAWDSTKEFSKESYEWVVGSDDDKADDAGSDGKL